MSYSSSTSSQSTVQERGVTDTLQRSADLGKDCKEEKGAVVRLHRSRATLGTKQAEVINRTILPITDIYAYSLNGKSGEDRCLIGQEVNPYWAKLDSAAKKAVLNSTIAKLQYLTWDLLLHLANPQDHYSGACMTIFIPGDPGFFVHLGDTVAVNLDDQTYLTDRPVTSLVPAHNVSTNKRERLTSGINLTNTIGDPYTAIGVPEKKIAPDPRFEIAPYIDMLPQQMGGTNLLLASDAIVDHPDKALNLAEIQKLILSALANKKNVAKVVANEIVQSSNTKDDVSVVIFNSMTTNILGVIDGHGLIVNIYLLTVDASQHLPDCSSVVAGKLPIIIKYGSKVLIYGMHASGKRNFAELDAKVFSNITFPAIGKSELLSNNFVLPPIYAEIIKHGYELNVTAHYTANAIQDNFCWLFNLEVLLYFHYCQAQASLQNVTSLASQLRTIDPSIFGKWENYRHSDETTYKEFFVRFQNEMTRQISAAATICKQCDAELKITRDQSKTSNTAAIIPTTSPSVPVSSKISEKKDEALINEKSILLKFAKLTDEVLKEFQTIVHAYNREGKAYKELQLGNRKYNSAAARNKSLGTDSGNRQTTFVGMTATNFTLFAASSSSSSSMVANTAPSTIKKRSHCATEQQPGKESSDEPGKSNTDKRVKYENTTSTITAQTTGSV